MAKRKFKRRMDYGGTINIVDNEHNYVDNPYEKLAQNDINWAAAKAEAKSNPLTQIGKMVGQGAMQVGGQMVTKGMGEMAETGKMGKLDLGETGKNIGKYGSKVTPSLTGFLSMISANGGAYGYGTGPNGVMATDETSNNLRFKSELDLKAKKKGIKGKKEVDNPLEDTAEFFDPTGILSWDDFDRTLADKNATKEDKVLAGINALPIIGKATKVTKGAEMATKMIKGAQMGSKFMKNVNKAKTIYRIARNASQVPEIQDFVNSHFAYGGTAENLPAEVEGKEVMETPDGEVAEFKGPSHEQGGIDVNLPQGTDIYSDRISIDGKTMAEHKKKRERKFKILTKKLEKSPDDILLKNSVKRVAESNAMEDARDLEIQNKVSQTMNAPKRKFLWGVENLGLDEEEEEDTNDPFGFVTSSVEELKAKEPVMKGRGYNSNDNGPYLPNPQDNFEKDLLYPYATENYFKMAELEAFQNKNKKGLTVPETGLGNNELLTGVGDNGHFGTYPEDFPAFSQYSDQPFINDYLMPIAGKEIEANRPAPITKLPTKDYLKVSGTIPSKEISAIDEEGEFNGANSGMTPGDIIGMGGNLAQAYLPYLQTLHERAGDSPNRNFFKNYGKKAEQIIANQKGYVKQVKDESLKAIEQEKGAAIRRNRNTARSVNTQRALDINTDNSAMNAKNKAYFDSISQMTKIMDKEADLSTDVDEKFAKAEGTRDEYDRKDRSNYYKQKARDLRNIGEAVSRTGKSLNAIKQRRVSESLNNQLFDNTAIDFRTGEVRNRKFKIRKT
jgi:hypothetical protein